MTKYERINFTLNIPRYRPKTNEFEYEQYKSCFMGQPNIDSYTFGNDQISERDVFSTLESLCAEDILLVNWDGSETAAGRAGSILNWVFKED